MNKDMPTMMEALNSVLKEILTGALKGKYAKKAIDALQTDEAQEKLAEIIKENMPTKVMTKTKRKKKDPEKPKRGCSSYIFFCKDMRAKIKEQFPDMTAKDITSELGKRWKDLSDEDKEQYIDDAATDKARYMEEMKEYTPSAEWVASDSDGGKKSKKKRKPGPKRALSAYIFFCQEMREKVKEENDEMSAKDITSELGRMWREEYKDDEKKSKKFTKMAKKDKDRYEEEKSNWVDPEPTDDSEPDAPVAKKKRSSKKKSSKNDNSESEVPNKTSKKKKKSGKVTVKNSHPSDSE